MKLLSMALGGFLTAAILFGSPVSAQCAGEEARHGLSFSVGERGLDSLSFSDQSFFRTAEGGDLQPAKPVFDPTIDAAILGATSTASAKRDPDSIELTCPWGRVSCSYRRRSDTGIALRIQVTNTTTAVLKTFSLRLMELNFPSIPDGATLDAGMFGYGFTGDPYSLSQHQPLADPEFVTPIVRLDFGTSVLNFCSDDLECSVSVPYSTNSQSGASYPFMIACHDIRGGSTKTFDVSFRFGPAGATMRNLSADVLNRYAEKYPFQIRWKDHRPIGAIYLASSGTKVATNPRRWIMKNGKIDISTDEGKMEFRRALLDWANNSIDALKDVDAQGMIVWDPEGQEFLGSVYYGDPRLTPTLAPEMEFKNRGGTSIVDEYFQKFRAAGLKVGVCIRPQQIRMTNGIPVQEPADDQHAAQVLKDKIGYARKRWGCTLFYVDSTYAGPRPLNPGVFKAVADAYPDVLLIPENESMRYFAYSAPLNSYVDHKVTSTPAGARMVYPKAFSVLMAPTGDRPEDRDALMAAIRSGDILLFNGYKNFGATKIKELYKEAMVTTTSPVPEPHQK